MNLQSDIDNLQIWCNTNHLFINKGLCFEEGLIKEKCNFIFIHLLQIILIY